MKEFRRKREPEKKRYLERERQHLKEQLAEAVEQNRRLEQEKEELLGSLSEKEKENRRLLEERDDLEKRRRSFLKEEGPRELEELRAVLKKQAEKELEKAKKEELEKIRSSVRYTVRRKADEELLEAVRESAGDRERFEQRVCGEITQTSRLFQTQTDQAMRHMQAEMRQMQEEMTLEMQNAVNRMVDITRNIRSHNYDLLAENFCSLQESLYYNVSEKELGLSETKIERYLARFLRVLKKLGFECVIPTVGEAFDSSLYEEAEPRDAEPEEERGTAEPKEEEPGAAEAKEEEPGAAEPGKAGSEEAERLFARESGETPEMLLEEQESDSIVAELTAALLEVRARGRRQEMTVKDVVSYGFLFDGMLVIKARVTLK